MATRTETAQKNRHYNQLLEKLHVSLPKMKDRCTALTNCDLATVHPKDLLAQLEDLGCDAADVRGDVDDFVESGEELMSILEELDCLETPKAKAIDSNLKRIRLDFTELTSLIQERRTYFQDVLRQYEATESELNDLLSWVQRTLDQFKASYHTSLDLPTLNEQLATHNNLLADVRTHEPSIKLVVERCRSFGIHNKVSELDETFQELLSQVNSHDQKLRNIRDKLSSIKEKSERITTWISNASLQVSSISKNGTLRMKFESLYNERLAMEKFLECVRKTGKELIADPSCSDTNCLRDVLANLQSSWRQLNGLIVSAMSSMVKKDVVEFNSFAVKMEEHFSQKEVLSADQEEISVRLSCNMVLREELSGKQKEADLLLNRFDRMLQDHVSSESDRELSGEMATAMNRLDVVCKMADKRVTMLNEALPLVSHLHQTCSELGSGLADIERDINAMDVEHAESTEHIRINQYNLKLIHEVLDGYQTNVNDAVSVGVELKSLCPGCDDSQIVRLVSSISQKYEAVKKSLKRKSIAQEQAFKRAFSDVTETILNLQSKVQSLSDRIAFADSVAANIFILNQQLTENKDVITELDQLKITILEVTTEVENLIRSSCETEGDGKRDEIKSQLENLITVHSSAECAANGRTEFILQVLSAAEKFYFDFLAVSDGLHDLRDKLALQKPPALLPDAVKQQQKDLQLIQDDLERVSQLMESCLQTSAPSLEALGAADADREIKKCSDDFEDLQEEIRDAIRTRVVELETALEIAESFAEYSRSVMSWLPEAELKIKSMTPIADTSRAVRIQIEEFKVFKVQMYHWHSDIHRLGQFLSEMSSTSPERVDNFAAHVKHVNDRWHELIRLAHQREENLRSALIELGEIDHAVEDVMGLLLEIESELVQLSDVYGDARYIELHLKRVESMLKDIANQKGIIQKLNNTIEMVIKRSGRKTSPLADRQQEMMSLYNEVQASARDRRDELLDRLKEIKGFIASIDETIKWLNNFKWQLKISRPMGALLDTVHVQYSKIMMACQELEDKEEEVKAILINGQDMFFRCQQDEGSSLKKKLTQLQILLQEAKAKAKLIKAKIEDHIEKVEKFHGELSSQTKWLNNMEKRLKCLKHPSKLVDKVLAQLQQLQECETDIKAHSESMKAVDQNGTYLKYFGSKQDTVYIKNLLMATRIRWKKLLQTADETHRILEHACGENKRFLDAWKTLCDWMNEAEERLLHKFMICPSGRTKQDLDELKRFDLQMCGKQPLYCITRRHGISMRDRCSRSDPEKAILSEMIEELSSKWTQLRSIVLQPQEKVDDCLLLSPGHCSDTLESMLGWLKKSEIYLSDKQLILGDINTVALLMDQHKEFQQELLRRMDIIQKIPENIPSGKNDLSGLLEKVKAMLIQIHHMSELRQASLHEAIKLAEDFNESLEDIQRWLPLAEAELKFRSIPNDEDGIIRVIENHDKFHEDLIGQEPHVEKMMYLAEEILVSCHPKAVSIIKYHMTIVQTRWQQALRRSKARSERLQEALNDVRRSATLEEELNVWLGEAEKQLKEKERESLPNDRPSLERLLKEQSLFHQALCSRSKDIDKLMRFSVITGSSQSLRSCSSQTLCVRRSKELSPSDTVITEFRQRWQVLWQQSADRKKLLEDMVEQMIQAERGETFDYDQWRIMAQDWFRARKLRISDVFRQRERNVKGVMTKKQFVDNMVSAKFPSNASDLRTVFDYLDVSHSGSVTYREIVKALLSDYQAIPSREFTNLNESDIIREEFRQQMSRCQCLIPFIVQRIDDNKFKFGEKGKLCLVRFVNSSITVRVGGGWMPISEFMDNFDPCRVKQRPSSRGGLTSPPERTFPTRGGQISPPESGLSSGEMKNLTAVKEPDILQTTSEINPRNEKLVTSCMSAARPKGLAVKHAARNSMLGTSSSPKVHSAHSPTNKRKSYHDNRKQSGV